MKKILLGSGTCALALAGVGAAFALNVNSPTVEAKASTLADGYYLTGSWNGYSVETGCFPLVDNTANTADEFFYKGFVFSYGESTHIQMIGVSDGYVTWYNNTSTNGADSINCGASSNHAWLYVDSGYQVIDIYIKRTGSCYFAWGDIYAQIGDEDPIKMTNHDSYQVKASFNDVSYGDEYKFTTINGEELNFMIKGGNNNISSKKTVITGGDIDLYLDKYKIEVWASNYNDSFGSFLSGFLNDTISGEVCANPTLTDKEGESSTVWDYYKNVFSSATLNDNERESFNAAVNEVALKGAPYDYNDSVLQQAASRYVWLMEKYAGAGITSFDGVSPLLAKNQSNVAVEPVKNVSGVIAITSTVIAASVIGGFFFIRKRKEN